jgi:hypothetical protein
VDWTTGSAETIHFLLNQTGTKIDIFGVNVDPEFINYAAQSRVQDNYDDAHQFGGLYAPVTGNSYWNASISKYEVMSQYYFLTRYNNIIYANNTGQNVSMTGNKGVGFYIPHDPFSNNSEPYGEATPNRQGGGLSYKGDYINHLLQPSLGGSYFKETKADWWLGGDPGAGLDTAQFERTFTRGQGGLKVDLGQAIDWLPLAFWGGVTLEQTEDGVDSSSPYHYVDLVSQTIDFGLDYRLTKTVHLLGGYKHQQWDGSEFINTGSNNISNRYTWFYSAYLVDCYSSGISWDLSKSTNLSIAYTQDNIWQGQVKQDGGMLYDLPGMAQEIDASIRMKF